MSVRSTPTPASKPTETSKPIPDPTSTPIPIPIPTQSAPPSNQIRIEELKKKVDGMIETVSGRIIQLEEFKKKQISLLGSI